MPAFYDAAQMVRHQSSNRPKGIHMKTVPWILSAPAAAVLGLTGCSKSGDGASVDAAPVEKSFASADSTLKAAADKAVAAIKSADYSSATAELQKLAANVKMTEDQK
jgi:hypothetical protein